MAACRMNDLQTEFSPHIPVLLKEAVDALAIVADGVYVDATFGRGSHSRAILNKLNAHGRLIAFDKDPEAIAFAKTHFAKDARFSIYHSSFADMHQILSKLNLLGKVNGILFDLGVSSPQLDTPSRGFSFSRPGKLDMRMDVTKGADAASWLAEISELHLANVLWQYGEERFSRRIAKAIVAAREVAPITTTDQLAQIIANVMPKPKGAYEKHPATRSFQAIRIAVNAELTELETALQHVLEILAIFGRLAIISFHSLEDRIVKQYIRLHEKGEPLPRGLPIKGDAFSARFRSVSKAIKPSMQEINHNPRARSAILRIAEKLL